MNTNNLTPFTVCVKNLSKDFRLESQTINAVKDVSFSIERGKFVAIEGPSGSGKSTLLGIMGGLDNPTKGSVTLDTIEISTLGETRISQIRNNLIGFVFQFFNLIPTLTAAENIALPGLFSQNSPIVVNKRVDELLGLVNLEKRRNHRPHQLSGGEQQRVAIARALINSPKLLLCDEPTGNLDSETGKEIMDIILNVRSEYNTTVVIVTHDPGIAAQADRKITMMDGKVDSDFSKESVMELV